MRARAATLAGLVASAMLLATSAAAACTSERPTFIEAVTAAQAIARIELVREPAQGDADRSETHALIRALKGSLPAEITLEDPRSTLCGDTVGFWMDEGQQAVVAYGVPFYGTTLAIAWVEFAESVPGVDGSAPPPPDATTLDDIEAAIVAALPDTATSALNAPNVLTLAGLVLLAAAVAFATAAGRRETSARRLRR